MRIEPVIELVCSLSEFLADGREFFILFIPDMGPQSCEIERDEKCSRKKSHYPNAQVGPVTVEPNRHKGAEHCRVTHPKKRPYALFGYHRMPRRLTRRFYFTLGEKQGVCNQNPPDPLTLINPGIPAAVHHDYLIEQRIICLHRPLPKSAVISPQRVIRSHQTVSSIPA